MCLRNGRSLILPLLTWVGTVLGASVAEGASPADLRSRADRYVEVVRAGRNGS